MYYLCITKENKSQTLKNTLVMKKVIITLFAVLSVLSLNAETIYTNSKTGNELHKVGDTYNITGKLGIVPLGNKENTLNFLQSAEKSFMKDNLNKVIKFGDDKDNDYKLKEDKEGFYLIKVGIGGVKIRESDVTQFIAVLYGRSVVDGGKKLLSATKSGAKSFVKELKK